VRDFNDALAVRVAGSSSLFIPGRLASKPLPLVRLKAWCRGRRRKRPVVAECAPAVGKPDPVH